VNDDIDALQRFGQPFSGQYLRLRPFHVGRAALG
jgi:hypothetical protein